MSNDKEFPNGIELIVGAYIINDNNEILLFQSPKWKNQWTICGGHVEVGESLNNALIREVREEIGVDIKVLDVINVGDFITCPPEFKRKAHFVYIDSIVKIKSENFKFNDEISAYKWFKIPDAIKIPNLHNSCRNGITKVQEWLKEHSK